MDRPQASKPANHSLVLGALLASGGLSRAELHRRTELRPNTVCDLVDEMIAAGWVREAGAITPARRMRSEGRGRPAVMVEVDPDRCEVLGLSLKPKRAEVSRVNLLGERIGEAVSRQVMRGSELGRIAGELVRGMMSDRTLAVGVASTGLLDEGDMKLLFSSSAPDSPGLSLGPVLAAVHGGEPNEQGVEIPIALENDIHALSDRWRMTQRGGEGREGAATGMATITGEMGGGETVLLVKLDDGEVGASLMVGGRSADAGCVRGGNELGHMQIATGTPDGMGTCYCGQQRCLERLFSSRMVTRLDGSRRRLSTVLRDNTDTRDTRQIIMRGVAEGVANAVNLIRPHRVVWTASGSIEKVLPIISDSLNTGVRERVLPVLRERVRFDVWLSDAAGNGETLVDHASTTAGYLALAVLAGRRLPASGEVCLRPSSEPAL